MSELAKKKCVPCSSDAEPMKGDELKRHMDLIEEWTLEEDKQLKKSFKFKNFKEALHFVNEIGKVAEEEGHHPDIELGWGKVVIKLMTHKIHGLSEADFILAAKCDVTYTSLG
jgi:4a-hydroxytetrahydrobiopterin dehydratase